MDSSCSDVGDARLSLSLVSYGSDVEDPDAVLDLSNVSEIEAVDPSIVSSRSIGPSQSTTLLSCIPNENELLMSVAQQMGLSGITPNKLNQLLAAHKHMKSAQQKYIEKKAILDAVVKVADTSSMLPPGTAQRVNQVLQHVSLLDFVTPNDSASESTVGIFGISKKHLEEQYPCQLTIADKKHLRNAVSAEISAKHKNLEQLNRRHSEIMEKISGPLLQGKGKCAEQIHIHELVSLRSDLDSEIATNTKYMEQLDTVLCKLSKLRLGTLDEINSKRLSNFQKRCETLKIKIRHLNAQILHQTYLEDPHLIEAYTKLKSTLDLAVDEAKSELSQLKKKEAEFDKLSGTHFDQLVKEYNDLKNQIAEKEYALNSLTNYN